MNIEVGSADSLTTYRKIAIASWRHPRDPTTYSWIDLPVETAEKFLNSFEAEIAPTLTHFVALIMGDCVNRQPEFNRFLKGGRLHPRKSTDAFITTLLRNKKGNDLSGFVLRNVTEMSLVDAAANSAKETERLRKGEDKEMVAVQRKIELMPSILMRPVMALQELVGYRLNWNPKWVGMPKDRFGSFIISNIGALGLERGLIPLSPYSRCPIIIGLGKPREEPVARNGQVRVERVITMSMTFDHRFADGIQGAMVLRRFQKIFANPEGFPDVFKTGIN
jgi:pyruvate dehydrogenase E2 component (dihydrolipoamide acetyltransferase)